MPDQNTDDKQKPKAPTGTGIALGVSLGTALGAAFDQLGMGVALGTALGAGLDCATFAVRRLQQPE
ncbi:MAG: hypothetical protein AAGE01_14880 [Pseudomonadota bacterium]